jgi:ABC-type dipeptide/oligopeptide/nickel transport system permease subunit
MEILLVVAIGLLAGAIGVAVGMLAAPRIDRWLQRRESDDTGPDGN